MDDDILTFIFNARVEELSLLTQKDKDYLVKFCSTDKAYTNLEKLINQNCTNNSANILSSVDDFVDDLNFESGYFNEKYYKQGFADGVNLMRDIMSKLSL